MSVSSHGYTYDALNRRTRAALEDGSYWLYDYNDRNELTGARRYWPDQSPIAGQHFGYGYDTIGNRQSARSGGDVNGWNLRETTYTANGLNQYTSIVTPGYEDIVGVTWATNTVEVNSGAADRKVEYFHREITVANGSGPVWQAVTVTSGGVSSNGGFVFPKNSQTLTYDADGKLTFDGVWTYEWDAENRLKVMTMTNVSGIANSNRLKLEFAYDFRGRRAQEVVIVRLKSVIDRDGRTNTLTYGNNTFPHLITAIQDPYGRSATFSYNTNGWLTSITDMAGMVSSFQYNTNGVITNLHTPYGDTGFRHFNTSTNYERAIEITEPGGSQQLYAYRDSGLIDYESIAGTYATTDPEPHKRNSFHWDRAQFAALSQEARTNYLAMPRADYFKASMKHWLLKTYSGSGGRADASKWILGMRLQVVQWSQLAQGKF